MIYKVDFAKAHVEIEIVFIFISQFVNEIMG